MYNKDELLVYGSNGVCRVVDIITRMMPESEEMAQYYVLKPEFSDYTITTPVENPRVFVRKIISESEAKRLIDTIPSVSAQIFDSRVLRELTEHYDAYLRTHKCEDLIEVVLSIRAKRERAELLGKKFGVVDEKYLKRSEELLFGELACAIGIEKDAVREYVNTRVGKQVL